MVLARLLSTEQDIKRLLSSKKLVIYVQGLENETTHVVLINEKHEPFSVTNEPYDHPFWGEIDRLSICCDENYCEELLKYYSEEKNDWQYRDVNYIRFSEICNPRLSVYREKYEVFSAKEKRKEQVEADFALLLESKNNNVLIYCSELGARLYVINDERKIKEVLDGSEKII